MVSHEHKCIFIHVPKCAGTSIEKALGHYAHYQGRNQQDHRGIRRLERPFPTRHCFSAKENVVETWRRQRWHMIKHDNPSNLLTVTRQQYESYYKFSIVRNPWARAFSWYQHVMRDAVLQKRIGAKQDATFAEFLAEQVGRGNLRPQTYWLKSFDGKIRLDFIGRFEHLNRDFKHVCKVLGLPSGSLSHENRGHAVDYREHYDPLSINLVASGCREDIEIFGYSFDA